MYRNKTFAAFLSWQKFFLSLVDVEKKSLRHLFRTADFSIFSQDGRTFIFTPICWWQCGAPGYPDQKLKDEGRWCVCFSTPFPGKGGGWPYMYIYKYTCLVFFMASVVGLRFFRWWICRARVLETKPQNVVRGSPLAFNVVFLCVYLLFKYIHTYIHTYI